MKNIKTKKKPAPSIFALKNTLLDGDAEAVQIEISAYLEAGKNGLNAKIDDHNAGYFKLLSVALKDQGSFKPAEEATLRLLQFYLSKDEKENCADCYLNLAIIYRHLSRYNESLINLPKALDLYTELGNDKKIAKCEQTMSLIYYFLEYHDEALLRVTKAQNIYKEAAMKYSGDEFKEKYIQHGLIACKHLQGIIKFDGTEKAGALKDLLEAKETAEKAKKGRLLGYICQDLARYYLTSNSINVDKASLYLKQSENESGKLKDKRGIANCELYKGILESKMAKWDKAISCYLDAEIKAREIDVVDIRIKAYLMLFEAYSAQNNHSAAVDVIKDYVILKQRESEKKQTNRVNLEKLLPLNDEIKTLKAELEKAKMAINLAAETLDLLVPKDAKRINKKTVSVSALKTINENRKNLHSSYYDYKIPALIKALTEVKNVLTKEEEEESILWRKDKEHLLGGFYEKLKEHKMISDCGPVLFKKIISAEVDDHANYIIWKKSNKHLAFLFHYFEANKLVDPEYKQRKFRIIKSKFKKGDVDFNASLNNEFTFVKQFVDSPDKIDKTTFSIYKEIKELVEEVIRDDGK